MFKKRVSMPEKGHALRGRSEKIKIPEYHYVNGHPLEPPYPEGLEPAIFGLGCFWGAERLFWQQEGVYVTAVGYAGGYTENPTYDEVCSGLTGHAEVVRLMFDPHIIGYRQLLKIFWESHDPTQGMRQGNDIGSQYRSVIFTFTDEQQAAASASLQAYQAALQRAGLPPITTEVKAAPEFYFAEPYHQQYLAKNPSGYCGLRGTGVDCPVELS
jgi:peptide-methionine (S)-S-oxide reductase